MCSEFAARTVVGEQTVPGGRAAICGRWSLSGRGAALDGNTNRTGRRIAAAGQRRGSAIRRAPRARQHTPRQEEIGGEWRGGSAVGV